MKRRTKPLDEFHAHEAMDRAAMLCNVVSSELLSHPYVQANAKVRDKIEVALSHLVGAYQALGLARFQNQLKK
jgi:hypothetical protein